MMMSGRDGGFPFTASQWQELEHQALIFKYMVAGVPIPPDLLLSLKRSFDSSLSSKLLLHQPHHVGWNCFQMGFGRKIDPEPGRCRRTDGKKWRCSKEAHTDSKYCERHMHRGRNRSRKPVEVTPPPPPTNTTNNTSSKTLTPTIPKYPSNPSSYSLSSMASPDTNHINHSFLYPHSSTRPPGNIGPYSHTDNDYRRNRYGDGIKEEVDEHVFFSERTMRSSSSMDDSWQLTMGSSLTQHLEQRIPGYSSSMQLQLQGLNDTSQILHQDHHCYSLGDDEREPQKVMHHFFDEGPPTSKDSSWPLDSDDKYSDHTPAVSTTQLSISMPKYSHDFFGTRE